MKACWSGFDIDIEEGRIVIPKQKVDNLKLSLEHCLQYSVLPAKTIASITGNILSMSLAIGNIARLRTHSLYALLHTRSSWNDILQLSEEAREELIFWHNNIELYNGRPIWCTPSAIRVVYSDASDMGFGSYLVEHGDHIVHGQWTVDETKRSSTWRELHAVSEALQAIASKLTNQNIRWFTDNQNVVRILQLGSGKEELQKEALAIFRLAILHNIVLEPAWIPREHNEIADYLSRIVDFDDWGLSQQAFTIVEVRWSPHTIDRFANHSNTKLQRFNSRFLEKGSEAVDAFTVNWVDENNYFCLPIYLVPRVLYHAMNCRCKGTLIVPEWPSAAFWPLIYNLCGDFEEFVIDYFYFPIMTGLFVQGKRGGCLFKDGIPTSNVLALRINFS